MTTSKPEQVTSDECNPHYLCPNCGHRFEIPAAKPSCPKCGTRCHEGVNNYTPESPLKGNYQRVRI